MNKAKSIGIVAGWGDYPLAVARALQEKGHEVVVAAVHGHASKEIESLASHVKWIGVCKLGGMPLRPNDITTAPNNELSVVSLVREKKCGNIVFKHSQSGKWSIHPQP